MVEGHHAIWRGGRLDRPSASERGGHVAATLYSLIGTCKLHRIEPYAYLKDVLQRLPSHPINRLAELLPFSWKTARA
jgi:transposase